MNRAIAAGDAEIAVRTRGWAWPGPASFPKSRSRGMRVAKARRFRAQLAYQSTALHSLAETENALTSYGCDQERREHLHVSAQASRVAHPTAFERLRAAAAGVCLPARPIRRRVFFEVAPNGLC
jgi:hypothetical protein